MVNELNALESKVAQVASLCRALRAENALLRQQIAATESERKSLLELMDSARVRIEHLAEQLAAEKTPA